ncbi:MAG TPA: transglutaminase-like domain-containing protein [Chthonomonadales bacterium]|nr:transglutaminase-like domain-containing protein [Chthonomonadales bacterium]
MQEPYFVHKEHFVFIPDSQFTHLDPNDGPGTSDRQILDRTGEIETDIRATSLLPQGEKLQLDAQGHYYVDLTNVPPTPLESNAPPIAGQIYHVEFYYIFTPSLKIFWQKEMDFWSKALDKYIAPTPLIASTAKEIASGASAPLDKARMLYALVQKFDNQDLDRLASIAPDDGAIPTGSVEAVLRAKRGSSRQLTFLYLSLARAAGLDARAIRLAGRDRHLFNAQSLDTSQLDSVIVGINIDGKEIYLDPGERMAPFETLYWAHAGAGGVALDSSGKVETLLTPLQENRANTVVRVGTLSISPQGAVSGTLKVGFIGQQALAWRQLSLRQGAGAVQQEMQQRFDAELPSGVQAHIERIAGLDDPEHQLVAVLPVTGMLATSAGRHMVLPRLIFDTRNTNPFPDDAQRVWPVDMHYPAQEQEQITYQLPAGFKLDAPPAEVNLRWAENAAYILRTQVAGNSVTNARILARGFTLLDPSQYSGLHDFYQKVAENDHQQISLDAANSKCRVSAYPDTRLHSLLLAHRHAHS